MAQAIVSVEAKVMDGMAADCEVCDRRYIRALGCVTCKGQRDVNSKVVATCGVG